MLRHWTSFSVLIKHLTYQGVRQKIEIIPSEIKNINLDIKALTTERKVTGTSLIGDYVYTYTGVPKEKRTARGVSRLINKKLKNKITNWETANENILNVNIQLYGHSTTVIAV